MASAAPEPPATVLSVPSQATLRATLASERHACRLARHAAVWTMRREGWRVWDIAARLGVNRTTVVRDLRDPAPPPPSTRHRRGSSTTLIVLWRQLVAERWQAGQRNGRALHRELRSQGFAASYPTLARHLQSLRRADSDAGSPRSRSQAGQRPSPMARAPTRAPGLTPRATAWAVLRKRPDMEMLARITALDPALAEAVSLSRDFVALVRERQPEGLDAWLARAQDGAAAALLRFATRLLADYDAARAALSLDWSSGQTEGQINRLKALKRAMYGRAGLNLLERRFLLAP